jgi:disulfide bond formation protein DsbB
LEIDTILLFLFIIAFLFSNNLRNKTINFFAKISNQFSENFIPKIILYYIFIISFTSSFFTLVYSEYFGIIPCALCWFERIFMYPTVFISFLAILKKDFEKSVFYIFIFSIFGGLISLYHHILQITASRTSHLPCPASSGDCAKMIIFEYGHITFPFMAFVAFTNFALVITFYYLLKKKYV